MKQLFEFFEDKPVASVLDIGTGSGDFIDLLAHIFPGAQLIGIDPDGTVLSQARQKLPQENIQFRQMEAQHLGFPGNTFDVVAVSNALHHLPSPEMSFAEMKRVVKPSGWILISELVCDNLTPAQENQKLFHHLRSRIDRLNGIFHRETFSRQEIFGMVTACELTVKHHFEFSQWPQPETRPAELQFWKDKMQTNLKRAEGFAEYEELAARAKLFEQQISESGFQPATNLVILAQK